MLLQRVRWLAALLLLIGLLLLLELLEGFGLSLLDLAILLRFYCLNRIFQLAIFAKLVFNF